MVVRPVTDSHGYGIKALGGLDAYCDRAYPLAMFFMIEGNPLLAYMAQFIEQSRQAQRIQVGAGDTDHKAHLHAVLRFFCR